ncbi:hypothetical protein TKK_0003144 [Trichogramma kaykai]|uniref:Uncharacterized protein n=1 Tax=Trichogramma kaykai TaxID=54128 RepID=A0ABD2WSB0_9HYME
MSKSNKDRTKKCPTLRYREKQDRLLQELYDGFEKLMQGDCERKCKKNRKKARRRQSSPEGACGGVSEDEQRNVPRNQAESSDSEDEDPRPGCSRDPPRRRKCRHQRTCPERSSDSSSCSPQLQEKPRKRKPCPKKCDPNGSSLQSSVGSPKKELCESKRNKAKPPCDEIPQIQRLRIQLIDKVRKKAPDVQEQVKRAIRMMNLEELKKFHKKTRDQEDFTKAQCDQFQRMYDEWKNSIKVKESVPRSIKGPVGDYWDRRQNEPTTCPGRKRQRLLPTPREQRRVTALLEEGLKEPEKDRLSRRCRR